MTYNRRKFLQQASLASAGLALAGLGSQLMGCNSVKSAVVRAPVDAFGLQLYTLRDVLPQDPKSILRQVAQYGYKQVEGYESEHGMTWGMGNKEFATFLNDIGLKMVSSHCDIGSNFEQRADAAAEIGMQYLIAPSLEGNKNLDFFKRAAERFNECGAICAQRGMRFAYHNHDYSFKPVDGQLPQDVLMQNTNGNNVDFEIDIFWVVSAGQDPVEWFRKYPTRFKLAHIKDKRGDETVTLGKGTIDFTSILRVGKEQGLQYYIVEQEHYAGTTPLHAAQDNANYMRKLTL